MLPYCSLHCSLISHTILPYPVIRTPVFKPCIFFDTRQSDYCILLCIRCSVMYTCIWLFSFLHNSALISSSLLSPVPSFTSDPFPIPPIFLTSYSDNIPTYYLFSNFLIHCSVSVRPWLTIPSDPSWSRLMKLSNTLCSGIMCQLIPICLIVLLLFSVSVLTKLQSLYRTSCI